MLTKDGDLGDDARYIFCAPFEVCACVDVGVKGRELEPEGTVLVAGEVERGDEVVPNFLDAGGVVAGLLVNGLLATTVLGVALVFISANVRGLVGLLSGTPLFAASWEEDPSFRFVGGVRLLNFTPPIFFSPPSFLRISRISGELCLLAFLQERTTGDSPRFCLEDRLSKYLDGLVESDLGKMLN